MTDVPRIRAAVVLLCCLITSCNLFETTAEPSARDVGQADAADVATARDQGVPPATDAQIVPPPDGSAELVDASEDVAPDVVLPEPEPEPPFSPPRRILFIGNSFTLGGPIPEIVDRLAIDAGWPDPDVVMAAVGGESLEGHSRRTGTVARVAEGDWDVVVLQEYSTRPTEIGNPSNFKEHAALFHDMIKERSPDARVVLYQTWARHPNHSFYPESFVSPEAMQGQLRTHYSDAAHRAIPELATVPVLPDVEVAPVGDAWEVHLARPDSVRLHSNDDYHANSNGEYLNALVLYSTIYRRSAAGLTSLGRASSSQLQRDADRASGWTTEGGPDAPQPPRGLAPGQKVQLDFGSVSAPGSGWTTLPHTRQFAENVVDAAGQRTSVDVAVTRLFQGTNPNGLAVNDFGWPTAASSDSLFCGSFGTHAQGLANPGRVKVTGLVPGWPYTVRLFASREGPDPGFGRLTRYTMTGETSDVVDFDPTDNTSQTVDFNVTATADGAFTLDVAVSPAGSSRFCYLGVMEITGG